ncbi:MAG: porin [Thiohalomonadales bacterium]
MNKKVYLAVSLFAGCLTSVTIPAYAGGVTVYKEGDKYVKLGGRIQLQYHSVDPDGGTKTDEIFFRRFRPYIEGSTHKDWKGKFQWDMGKAEGENEIAVKDAYMQYKGIKNTKISVGNFGFPFSREFLTSSKKQQLVERTFVGDHNYGTPDRNAGIHLVGHNGSKKLTWGASFASSSLDPDNKKMDFDSPVNANTDFNEGWIVGGRIDYHPLGNLKFSQGNFNRENKFTIGVAAYNWSNDDDNNTYTTGGIDDGNGEKSDVDGVTGLEISGAYRVAGLSIDAQFNQFSSDLVDKNVTSGLYKNGSTTLESWAVEGGYMVMANTLELVAAVQSQDADGYTESWDRSSLGLNWFIQKQDIKVQLTYRENKNKNGVNKADVNEIFLQSQYVF